MHGPTCIVWANLTPFSLQGKSYTRQQFIVAYGGAAEWDGRQGFGAGDVLGLLLQPEAGTLTVYKNNARLGQAVVPGMKLTNGKTVAGLGGGGLCWAVSISTTDSVELLSSADSLVYGTSTRSARGVAASHRDGLLLPAIRARGKLPPRLGIA